MVVQTNLFRIIRQIFDEADNTKTMDMERKKVLVHFSQKNS